MVLALPPHYLFFWLIRVINPTSYDMFWQFLNELMVQGHLAAPCAPVPTLSWGFPCSQGAAATLARQPEAPGDTGGAQTPCCSQSSGLWTTLPFSKRSKLVLRSSQVPSRSRILTFSGIPNQNTGCKHSFDNSRWLSGNLKRNTALLLSLLLFLSALKV